jgi:phenylacetate-coenzyme A ligase PaaK-like adenylate-forming protein
MMEHFDEIVTDPKIHLVEVEAHVSALHDDAQFLEKYWVMATSGSTGSPGIFLFGASEWAVTYEVSDQLCLFSLSCSCERPFALVEDIQGRAAS